MLFTEWMEGRAYYLQIGGVALAALAWVWLLVRAFRERRSWGIGSLVFPPLGFVFASRHPQEGAATVRFVLDVSAGRRAAGDVYARPCRWITSARESGEVGGEKHITLTGSDPKTAPDLKEKQDVAVLQMANPDVTDQSLESLKGMKLLQELDLNDTQVTDAGLEILKDLPALAKLRLRRTKITDKGFRVCALREGFADAARSARHAGQPGDDRRPGATPSRAARFCSERETTGFRTRRGRHHEHVT